MVAREPVGEAADQLVAGMVAERVVDVLEAVDVDAGDGEPGAVALGRLGEGDELGFEQAPVGQAGQRVVIGEMLGGGLPDLERAGGGEEAPGQRRDDDDADGEADEDERQHVLEQQQARAARRPGERAERAAVVGLEGDSRRGARRTGCRSRDRAAACRGRRPANRLRRA